MKIETERLIIRSIQIGDEKAGLKLLEKRMYKDIYDTEKRLYSFYLAKAF